MVHELASRRKHSRRAQVHKFDIVSKPETYLGISFSLKWMQLTIHGHVTLINGRCRAVSEVNMQNLEAHVAKVFAQDILLARSPSRPIMLDGRARRSTFPRRRYSGRPTALSLARSPSPSLSSFSLALFLLPRPACPA